MHQTGRMAVAIYANDQPGTGRPALASLAVATLWMISVGSDLEVGPPPECADLPDLRPLLGLPAAGKPRRTRLFRLGWLWVLVCQITARPLPLPWRLVPEPWPDIPICVALLPGPSQAEERVYG